MKKVGEAAGTAKGQSLKDIRKTYLAASMAMTQIGKALGVPEGSAEVQVFRCAMYPGDWLQDRPGTVNPYDSEMATCGVAIEKLPKVAAPAAATTRPAGAAGRVLAIPRSAVVDTGRQKIVYAEAKDPKFGTIEASFDMRALKLGALAKEYSTDGKERGEYYPVLEGLKDGERVVTEGAFLVDAENRLNPAR